MTRSERRRYWAEKVKGWEELDSLCPEWMEIVGEPGTATPFRQWLAEQAGEYQSLINGTDSSAEVAEAIHRFRQARLN